MVKYHAVKYEKQVSEKTYVKYCKANWGDQSLQCVQLKNVWGKQPAAMLLLKKKKTRDLEWWDMLLLK